MHDGCLDIIYCDALERLLAREPLPVRAVEVAIMTNRSASHVDGIREVLDAMCRSHQYPKVYREDDGRYGYATKPVTVVQACGTMPTETEGKENPWWVVRDPVDLSCIHGPFLSRQEAVDYLQAASGGLGERAEVHCCEGVSSTWKRLCSARRREEHK